MHGNRSPLADPKMRGMFTGLELSDSLNDLARKFNVTLEVRCSYHALRLKTHIQAIALQTKHIVDEMNARGHQINSIYMSGALRFPS